jgi:hypothetical protein
MINQHILFYPYYAAQIIGTLAATAAFFSCFVLKIVLILK